MAHVQFFKIEVKFSSSDTVNTKVIGRESGAIKKRYKILFWDQWMLEGLPWNKELREVLDRAHTE